MGLEPFQCGDRLWTSEFDVGRRQIPTPKDGLRAERILNYNDRRPIT